MDVPEICRLPEVEYLVMHCKKCHKEFTVRRIKNESEQAMQDRITELFHQHIVCKQEPPAYMTGDYLPKSRKNKKRKRS